MEGSTAGVTWMVDAPCACHDRIPTAIDLQLSMTEGILFVTAAAFVQTSSGDLCQYCIDCCRLS